MIDPQDITGLILAGGRGSRMGGVDKGLQNYQGLPLALHALMRLQPQVGGVMVNANRNLAAYESFGVPVWPDADGDFPGPLAGFLAGLERCETPFLATVPCDSPRFPADLVARLAGPLQAGQAEIAMACTVEPDGREQPHPVFSLMRTSVLEGLVAFMAGGQRRIERWAEGHRLVRVRFEEGDAFFNANTPDDLQRRFD
ncbi:MAG: molybdenum cofactor guanylyltransferase MobA [Pseudomonadota bacterium]|jgi:molybdopterin-guanine dinucleotide biosynthesis protein A